jgi:hypothetical protein
MYTTLGLPYIGEEAVYTITSLEMRLNHDYFVTTLYGTNYGRPPLLNWLIIPLAEMLGWDRMLLASRLGRRHRDRAHRTGAGMAHAGSYPKPRAGRLRRRGIPER